MGTLNLKKNWQIINLSYKKKYFNPGKSLGVLQRVDFVGWSVSHINPLLFQLFYAGLLVVGMFNEWSSTFISSEIVNWRYSFNWEMKTKKWMSNRRGGGVGVLLATFLAGKKWQSSLSDMTITLFCAGKLAFLASILSADSIVFKLAIFKARKAREHGWKGTAA